MLWFWVQYNFRFHFHFKVHLVCVSWCNFMRYPSYFQLFQFCFSTSFCPHAAIFPFQSKRGLCLLKMYFFLPVKLFNFASVTVFTLKEEEDKNLLSFYPVIFWPVGKVLLYFYLPSDRWKVHTFQVFFSFFSSPTDLGNLSCVRLQQESIWNNAEKTRFWENMSIYCKKHNIWYDKLAR